MPSRNLTVPERLSRIEGSLDASSEYARDRWHKQDNDLQQLMQLPERMTRDIAKIDGKFEGRISAVVEDLRRTITDAVEKAVEPISQKQADHEKRIDVLEKQGNIITGAKLLGIFVVQTFIAAATALAGAYELTRGPHG